EVLLSIHDARPPAGAAIWKRMAVQRYWLLLVNEVVRVYYAHPWAWDEIGFGGPAYPRGYMRLERGDAEPWEKPERRYEWHAPADSLSGVCTPLPERQ
ncbi:MAG TPA: gluconate 2-dehydrogenase subunit 3 family protein, partial [Terriglobales bacterium]|nr:gluconate 2-dehydrogenase subunit 3 family protein [Terriglobales bacterium]